MARKAQMELSTTVIVTMIVSIVLMSLGFLILFKVIQFGEDQVDKIQYKTEQELQNALNSDKKFFVVDSVQNAEPGKNVIIGVGVINRIADSEFKLIIDFDAVDNFVPAEPGIPFASEPVIPPPKLLGPIPKGEGKISYFELNIPRPAANGKYFFTIYACSKAVGDDSNNGKCIGDYSFKYSVGQAIITIN